MIEREMADGVIVLRMCHGKASALDTEFLEALTEAFAGIDGPCVLTGTGKIFSAGVDLVRLRDGGAAYLDAFLPALDRGFGALVDCPYPVVGACNGHAIAGGCILMAACDRRLMSEGRGRIGAPELVVGVPVPLLPLELMRFVAPQHVQELLYEGGTFEPADALTRGLIDRVVPAEALMERAVAVAQQMGRIPEEAFALTKRLLRAPLTERLETGGDAANEAVAAAWAAPAVRDAVARYVAETLGK